MNYEFVLRSRVVMRNEKKEGSFLSEKTKRTHNGTHEETDLHA